MRHNNMTYCVSFQLFIGTVVEGNYTLTALVSDARLAGHSSA